MLLRGLRKPAQRSTTLPMGVIRTNAAAAMLGVSPNTLRSWERRFGFPSRAAPPAATGSSTSARSRRCVRRSRRPTTSRRRSRSPVSAARAPRRPRRLKSAFARFDEGEANRILEESLAVRSVERTVEEVLLPAVETLAEDGGDEGPEHGFAWRWATSWLAAAMRVAPAATRDEGVIIFDASSRVRRRVALRPGARAGAAPARPAHADARRRRRPGAHGARPARGRAARDGPRRHAARTSTRSAASSSPRAASAATRWRSTTSAARCRTRARAP